MTLEVLNAVFTAATFLVIAATAIAAGVQLRHLRRSNDLQSILALRAERSQRLEEAYEFVRTELAERLKDPVFRAELAGPTPSRRAHPELVLMEYFEHIGIYIKNGLIPENVYFEIGSPEAYWPSLEQALAIYRRVRGPWAFENFEYLTTRARDFAAAHPDGNYPRGVSRIPVHDVYASADDAPDATLSDLTTKERV